MTSRLIGALGEQAAGRALRDKGYKLVAANYRTRVGEIDIIAQKDEYICFVEVKSRQIGGYLAPSEAVGEEKQHRIISSAEIFMASKKITLTPRFDIIEVLLDGEKVQMLNHITGAF